MTSPENETDFGNIDKTLAGETHAFDVLVRKYQHQMYTVAYRITFNTADAEDVTQQAFLKAFTHLGKFKRKSSFSTWLYRITCNIAINSYKAKLRERPGVEDHEVVTHQHGLRSIETREEIAAVRRAIRLLPKKQRLTLVLRVYENLPFKEIAAILTCSEGGVKANYFHAIAKMKKNLTPYVYNKEEHS